MTEWLSEWDAFAENTRLELVMVNGVAFRQGDRVRLRPQGRADILDLALVGQIAIIEAIEQDLENKVYLAVVLEDDPGMDLGMMRQPGHRFFFSPQEVEPVDKADA